MRARVRGWCPDLFTPMQSGDGWLLRLKPRLCRINAAHAALVARQSRQHGNGIIELTGRGNLQLRGLTPASAERFAQAAVAAGLAHADAAVERRRNIMLSPLAGEAACLVAEALEQRIAEDAGLADLPGKFGFAVDDGVAFGLEQANADVVLRATGDAWRVSLGHDAVTCARGDAAASAVAMARAWLASGAARPSRTSLRQAPDRPLPLGWQPERQAFGIGFAFGETNAATLQLLCALAQRLGDGVLHLTPWRLVLLSGVQARHAAALEAAALDAMALDAAADGLIVSARDPRLLVSACIGNRGCLSGSVDPRADARTLLAAGIGRTPLHVSGCAKGCAHPEPAAITLVGANGRYGLVRGGRAGDIPRHDGMTLSQLAHRLDGCDCGRLVGRS